MALIFVGDTCLYGFWGIKLDGTVWTYLDNPTGALSSVSKGYALGVTLCIVLTTAGVFALYRLLLRNPLEKAKRPALLTGIWLVAGGLLFLGIRGGVGKSTANVGMVYFSDRQFLNHAAVNPAFSLLASMQKERNFAEEFNFFDEEERRRILAMLHYNTQSIDPDTLLTTQRPNVLLILMEGCGGTLVNAVDPETDPNITPNLNQSLIHI